MNVVDQMYAGLIGSVLSDGEKLTTRNSVATRLVSQQIHFKATPLISTRKTAWKSALREWEWFMSGSNDINDLHESVRPWWTPWADADGKVFGNYSKQFRHARGHVGGIGYEVDQLKDFVSGVKDHPFSRRNVMTTWNAVDMSSPKCPITNCHGTVIQAFVSQDKTLSIVTYQRSCDLICGVPHNWIQYWAFLMWLAYTTGHMVGKLIWIGGDIHIYEEHTELARKIAAETRFVGPPEMIYRPTSDDFKADDFILDREYQPILTDRAKMIV